MERPRRLRSNKILRELVRETRISTSSLILPLFIKEGKGIKEEISALEGHFYYSKDTVSQIVEKALRGSVNSVILFGVPNSKDDNATGAYAQDGVVQEAIAEIKRQYPQMYVITDVCLCEYTKNGHCGLTKNGEILNDETLPLLAKTALSHVKAGADMVAPSDMMDGRVKAIREALDIEGYANSPIMAYSAKYASAFYGPFREVAGSAPSFGDRKTYQMDYHNKKEAIKEVLLDVCEGADIIMVKPALSYLDIISEVARNINLPLCAYSVSGEYAMLKNAGKSGLIDEKNMMYETATSIFRAGANMLITYYALELAQGIIKGEIG